MISIALVEDDDRDAEIVTECLSRYEKETGETINVTRFKQAFDLIDGYKNKYDLILMDIEMPYMNGMDAAKKLREYDRSVPLIFITNMAQIQYVVAGYSVEALDYFLKPVRYPELKLRLDKIKNDKSDCGPVLTLPYNGGLKCFKTGEILYLESNGHTILFHNDDGVFECKNRSMREMENLLAPHGFFRCNTSFIVNMKYVSEVDGFDAKVGQDIVPVSRERKKAFLEALLMG